WGGRADGGAGRGSYTGCEVAGEPVLVVRDASGQLRAMSNVCRHRGAILAEGCGSGSVIRCPYHSWSYSLDGRVVGVPEFEGVEKWDRSEVCLPQFRVEVWGPFLFVNLDPAAPPLAEFLGVIPREIEEFGAPFHEMRLSRRRDYVVN